MESWGYRLVRACRCSLLSGAPRPHKALPRSVWLEKHPIRRVGGAEGARKHSPAFAWVTPKRVGPEAEEAREYVSRRSPPSSVHMRSKCFPRHQTVTLKDLCM